MINEKKQSLQAKGLFCLLICAVSDPKRAPQRCLFLSFACGGSKPPPYGLIRECGSPPYCLVLVVCFIRAIRESPLRVIKISVPYFGEQPSLSVGEGFPLPQRCSHYLTATRRILINICRAGACSRRHVVRTIFRIRTNKRLPTNSVGGDVLDAPQRCSRYLSAAHKQTVSIDLGRGGVSPPATLFALSYGYTPNIDQHL